MIEHDIGQERDGDYSRCRSVQDILHVLEGLPHRKSVAWGDAVALAGRDMSALHAHSRLAAEAQSKNRVVEVHRAVEALEKRNKQ